MAEHPWPFKNPIPAEFNFFTVQELIETFAAAQVSPDTPLWIDNYWQIRRQIMQRPAELLYTAEDGFHLG